MFARFEEEVKTQKDPSEVELGHENYRYSWDLEEPSRIFMVKVFKNFIKNYSSLDTGKDNDIRGFLSQLINLSFNVISSDCHKLKKTGFSLIITLVKRF